VGCTLHPKTHKENDMTLGEMTSMGSRFAASGRALLLGSLVLGLAACGGEADDPMDEALGSAQSDLTSGAIGTPIQGQCTTTETINKVTLASGAVVIRSTCSETCKKSAVKMGIYNLYTVLPGGGASAMVSNLGAGPTRAAQVDVPYVPGTYSVACVSEWQEKVGSTTYFDQGLPYTGGQF
jgi:hypothetical protein